MRWSLSFWLKSKVDLRWIVDVWIDLKLILWWSWGLILRWRLDWPWDIDLCLRLSLFLVRDEVLFWFWSWYRKLDEDKVWDSVVCSEELLFKICKGGNGDLILVELISDICAGSSGAGWWGSGCLFIYILRYWSSQRWMYWFRVRVV
jgi:hypothetical protein